MNNIAQQIPGETLGSDLRKLFTSLRKKIRLIILCVLGAAIAGATYIVVAPKIYRAEALIEVEPAIQKSLQRR
jgi:uncharacterized protein involved in exopolysaccharide biosynthesis